MVALQGLLSEYYDLFEEPKSLPPFSSHNHSIPLIFNVEPVNIRPYRYPHFQKEEIERRVEEMLQSGIIQPSTDPYTSLVLVKKTDGFWGFCVD